MTDPYREASGPTCPRCHDLFGSDEAGAMICASGCGTWLPRGLVQSLVGSEPLGVVVNRVEQAPNRSEMLEPSTCVTCKRALDAHYPKIDAKDAVPVGICEQHGMWLQRHTQRDFEIIFDHVITTKQQGDRRDHEIEDLVTTLRTSDEPGLRDFARRFIALEERVYALEHRGRR